MGQGSASTAFAMITAEELNVPTPRSRRSIMGDTDRTPDGGISAGFLLGNPNVAQGRRLHLPGAARAWHRRSSGCRSQT